MPTVVPSQVRDFIDREFNYIPADNSQHQAQAIRLTDPVCASMRALLALVERVPQGLLPSDQDDFGQLISSLESIRHHVGRAETLDERTRNISGDLMLHPGRTSGNWNPVRVIRRVFDKCPDDLTPIGSKDLLFIKDAGVRAELLADLGSVRSALMNSEWKPSTVVAGSLAEALLLWAVDQKPNVDVVKARQATVSKGTLPKAPGANPENWGLEEYIAVVSELQIIEPDTRAQLEIVREFRNLIHPGRARRKSKRCDRGTALAANAGVELLSRDLQAKFP